jgi:general secretion pathway protein D
MVLNNQQAQIKVGDQVPISTGSAVSTISANAPVVNSIQYRDTGVILTVRPRINSGGLVILEVEQAVDEPSNTTSSSIQSPTILQRQIKSTVAVKDRETLALGGLIRDKRSQDINGVPWLSTIPIIGPLFGTTARSLNRTELVVLLTPRVVGSAGQSRALTNEFRRSLKGLYKSPGVYNPGVAPELDSSTPD